MVGDAVGSGVGSGVGVGGSVGGAATVKVQVSAIQLTVLGRKGRPANLVLAGGQLRQFRDDHAPGVGGIHATGRDDRAVGVAQLDRAAAPGSMSWVNVPETSDGVPVTVAPAAGVATSSAACAGDRAGNDQGEQQEGGGQATPGAPRKDGHRREVYATPRRVRRVPFGPLPRAIQPLQSSLRADAVRSVGSPAQQTADPVQTQPPGRPKPRGRTLPTIVPEVAFSDQRLANGLRVIVAEDHLAPVVAVNLWYGVGSKHEAARQDRIRPPVRARHVPGRRHVAKAEHIALVQAAGGTMNGSTWLDRTNYFETLPAHQLDLGLWLEADRMATLLDALSQENLDNQREVVKNEKRWSYDNRPYGSWQEKLQAHLFPPEHPYHHTTIGSMDDLDAASIEDVSALLPDLLRAEQRGPERRRRRRDRRRSLAAAERYFGRIPANPAIPPLGDLSLPLTLGGEQRETVYDRVPLPRVHVELPGARSSVTHGSMRWISPVRSSPAARAAGSIAGSSARSGSPRT